MTYIYKKLSIISALLLLVSCTTLRHPDGSITSENSNVAAPSKEADSAAKTGSTDLRVVENPKMDLGSEENIEVPKEVNDLVLKWIDYFQGRGRGLMSKYLSRSSRYIPMMKQTLKDNGLPEDLVYLALIESGFAASAKSNAGAVGFWQFIRATGKTYGLKINNLVDERRDPAKSTEAAANYLKGLYNLFGSWYLAIAAYNVGENRIKREVMDNFTRDFWELARKKLLPEETINYIPKFIAARMIAREPEKFGFGDIDYHEVLTFDTVTSDHPVSMHLLAKNMGIDKDRIKELNPAYRTDYIPLESGGSVKIRVPQGKSALALESLNKSSVSSPKMVARYENEGLQSHRVRPGDTLGGIAKRYGISLGELRAANDLSPRSSIKVGANIKIPSQMKHSARSMARRELRKPDSVKASRRSTPRTHYTVRRGDTLSVIARRYSVSMAAIRDANRLGHQSRLSVGKRLVIPD